MSKGRELLSKAELTEIEERNNRRKDLRSRANRGNWYYDSFAFLDTTDVPLDRRDCVIVRSREWVDKVIETHGEGILDDGITEGRHPFQPYHDAKYICAVLGDDVEADVERLLAEVERLRGTR
jgi:hypothetical protein